MNQPQSLRPLWHSPSGVPVEPCVRVGMSFIERASLILGVPVEKIREKSRLNGVVLRRFAIAHVMRDSLKFSYPRIARELGLKDHTSVIYGVKRSRELVQVSSHHARMVNALEMAS